MVRVCVLLVLTACGPSGVFICETDSQCAGELDGQCEASGFCSFPDGECESGRRYGEHAGDGLAGKCTEPTPPPASSTGVDATMGPIDASTGEPDPVTGAATASTNPPVSDTGSSSESSGGPPCGGFGDACCPGAVCDDGVCVDDKCDRCSVTVIANEYQTCAYNNLGRLDCWGRNDQGQLGDGSMAGHADPRTVDLEVSQANLGAYHGLAVSLAEGLPHGWGGNGDGQVDDTGLGPFEDPIGLEVLPPMLQLAAGGFHSCGIEPDGTTWCWGRNSSGQSAGPNPFDTAAVIVTAVTGATMVDTGGFHTCAVAGGELYCWGRNNDLQLGSFGLGGPDPDLVPLDGAVVAVAAGDYHTCALDEDGQVWCWGRDSDGQTGDADGDPAAHAVTDPVVGLPQAVAIAAGDDHSCAIDADGAVWCWGRNDRNQINGAANNEFDAPVSVELDDAVSIAAGRDHTCAATADGGVYCWGWNGDGALGSDAPQTGTPTLSDYDCVAGPA